MALPRDLGLLLAGVLLGAAGLWFSLPAQQPAQTKAPAEAQGSTSRLPAKAESCERDLASLHQRAKFTEMLYKGLRDEHFGAPVAWPADTPTRYTEAGFTAVIAEIMATCEPGRDLRGIECAEPPCIATMVDGEEDDDSLISYARIGVCPAWKAAFGDTVTTYSNTVDCPDGTQERVLLLSPYWEELAAPGTDEGENYRKRLDGRQEALMEAWECGAR